MEKTSTDDEIEALLFDAIETFPVEYRDAKYKWLVKGCAARQAIQDLETKGVALLPEMTTSAESSSDVAKSIVERLYGIGVDSETRADVMLRLVRNQPADVFWSVFLDAWSLCDDTWSHQADLLKLLRRHREAAPVDRGINEADQRFFASLPDRVVVLRGCSQERVRGLSWTTDYDVAEGFAKGHRGKRVPCPVMAKAVVPKEAIFAVFTDRSESEIVLDPRRLSRLAWTEANQ